MLIILPTLQESQFYTLMTCITSYAHVAALNGLLELRNVIFKSQLIREELKLAHIIPFTEFLHEGESRGCTVNDREGERKRCIGNEKTQTVLLNLRE
ncbi:hypothetical protein QE152_g25359 [Popillia japonica]|uniref:Uncharacterized protein n=1 Tax=Popillia japonica TaxID=7064 RepID=A0AAW1K1R3_POPJA